MPRLNLEDYEQVEVRIAKFYAENPGGRIITELTHHSDDFQTVVFRATIYRTDDQEALPTSTGYAEEHQGGNGPNRDCWLENCETSAIGRALANMGMHGNKRPSKEEMEKVQAHEIPHKPRPNYKKQLSDDIKVVRRNVKDGMPHKEWAKLVVESVLGHTNVQTEKECEVVMAAITKGLFNLTTGKKEE
jgi:hypothetical protein